MRHLRFIGGFLLTMSALLASASAVAEQVGEAPKQTSSWLSVLVAIVLVVAIGVGSFINPKRGHRD